MNEKISQLVQDVVASPLGDVIASVGEGVAAAQMALDEAALAKTLEIYAHAEDNEEGGGEDALRVLREIGYRPTFYALPETTGEVSVALALGNNNASAPAKTASVNTTGELPVQLSRLGLNVPALKPKIYVTPVDGGYANRFSYQANISAKLSFKIVPVPAPDGADELRLLPNFVYKKIEGSEVNRTVSEAIALAEQLGLSIIFINGQGETVDTPAADIAITAQVPVFAEGTSTVLRLGDEVTLTLAD